jgi:hypothetical protein
MHLAWPTAPPAPARRKDLVLGLPSYFSFAFADPDARLGYAYVMNKLDFYLADDPREKPLRDAVYRAMARLSAGRGRP